MAQKRRSSAGGANFPGLSGENSAKLRRVMKTIKDPEYPSDIPMEVREMFAVGVAEAVRSESQERHPAQSTVCSYVQECFASMQTRQKQLLEAEKIAKTQDGPQIQTLQSQLATADAEIEKAAAIVEMHKLGLAEKQRILSEAKAKLAEEEHSKITPAAEKASLDKLAAEYSKFNEGPLKIILDGAWDNEKEAQKASKQVMDEVLKMEDLEEAFLVAMPGTLAKRQSERGSFDNMVLKTLQGKLTDRSTTLGAGILAAEAKLATHEVEIEKCTKVVEEASKAKDTVEATLRDAEAQQASASKAQLSVKAALEERTEASVNRDGTAGQCELYIEMLEETAGDFKYLIERSAAAEKAAAAAAAAAEAAAAAAAAAEATAAAQSAATAEAAAADEVAAASVTAAPAAVAVGQAAA